jgi:hypothetical protein
MSEKINEACGDHKVVTMRSKKHSTCHLTALSGAAYLEQQAMLRIHLRRFLCSNTEERGVEQVRSIQEGSKDGLGVCRGGIGDIVNRGKSSVGRGDSHLVR